MGTARVGDASNAPVAPRSYSDAAEVIRENLGISDLEHNYNALVFTLLVKDQSLAAAQESIDRLLRLFTILDKRTHELSSDLIDARARLEWYEKTVPVIFRARAKYDVAVKAEKQRRNWHIKAHPELTEHERNFYLHTGRMPSPPEDPPQDVSP